VTIIENMQFSHGPMGEWITGKLFQYVLVLMVLAL
jgi:hypothetical protein